MTIITITVDETIASQDVFSPELGKYIHLDLLTQGNIDEIVQTQQKKITDAQKVLDKINTLVLTKPGSGEPIP